MLPLTADQISAIKDLGTIGLLAIALVLAYQGKWLFRKAVDELLKYKDDRFNDKAVECEAWKKVATDLVDHVGRLSDALEGVIHTALPK